MARRSHRAPAGDDSAVVAAQTLAQHYAKLRELVAELEAERPLPVDVRALLDELLKETSTRLAAIDSLDSSGTVAARLEHLLELLTETASTVTGDDAVPPPGSLGEPHPRLVDESPALASLETMDVPVNPAATAAVQAIYAGRRGHGWEEDAQGDPHFPYRSRQGQITLRLQPAPEEIERGTPIWTIVGDLTTETADVFLIILSRLAELPDPTKDTVRIRLEEIAAARGVTLRHGGRGELYEAFMHHVQALRQLRVTMTWTDPRGRGTISFGLPGAPELLLDIMNIEVQADGDVWHAFSVRAGQPLGYFMRPQDIRWIGRYATTLLRLNPQKDERVKKAGTFWCLLGAIGAAHRRAPRATPATLLEFMGEEADRRNPGRTVAMVQEIHERLAEIGLIRIAPSLDPVDRSRGFFDRWLESAVTVELAQPLLEETALPSPPRALLVKPPGAAGIKAEPALIKQFREEEDLTLKSLAGDLGISHMALSRYERGVRPVPDSVATAMAGLWSARRGNAS